GPGIPAALGGTEIRDITLNQYDVLNIETNRPGADLTGTYIETDRAVAVFGGTEAGNAPNDDSCIYRQLQDDWVCEFDRETPCWDTVRGEPNITFCENYITCCADHLEQQMLPIFAWGREFNAARSAPRGEEADIWRVLASENNTTVRLIGVPDDIGEPLQTTWNLNEGEWFEFESRADFEIESNQPISIGQFLAAEFAPIPAGADEHVGPDYPYREDAGTGDPAFITVVPREQYREDYIFLVPAEYEQNWVTIVAPAGVDIEHADEQEIETLEAEMFDLFADGEWGALRYHLDREGYHRLTAEQPFGVMVHGYDSFVSYGYPAGLDVKRINSRRE
ncbi:MAG: IgGFc-binding protein, partial [Myxococcales bacterium]|nr:IgGFc-binding protein [Myxococcales bacterium]